MEEQTLYAALKKLAPAATVTALETLSALLAEIVFERQSTESKKLATLPLPEMQQALTQLAGQEIVQTNRVICFGDQSQIGDVRIRDITSGDIYNIHLDLHIASNASSPPETAYSTSLDKAEIDRRNELIRQHRKVLYTLEIQAAKFGLYCPPHIIIEIEELKKEIIQLQKDL